jgi:uncharacterized protein CbrC (UPF0167 family)
MQFQIECNSFFRDFQTCLICNQQFEMKEARVIVCNEEGDSYGDICPHCIVMGSNWIGSKLQQIGSQAFSVT